MVFLTEPEVRARLQAEELPSIRARPPLRMRRALVRLRSAPRCPACKMAAKGFRRRCWPRSECKNARSTCWSRPRRNALPRNRPACGAHPGRHRRERVRLRTVVGGPAAMTTLTLAAAMAIAVQCVGPTLAPIVVGIAQRESGLDPAAVHRNPNGTRELGPLTSKRR